MAARARTRPRAARSPRSRRSGFHFPRLSRPELAGLAVGVLAIAAILIAVDVAAVLADIRDWLLTQFGAGLIVLAGLTALGLFAGWRRSWERDEHTFFRYMAGAIALGLFTWGALALNEPQWKLGAVDFSQSTLGGELGQLIVAGFLGKLAWLSLFVIGMAFVAPRLTRAFFEAVPGWSQAAWERRYPHRIAAGMWRFVTFIVHRPSAEEGDVVIGTNTPPPGPALEDAPIIFRPQIDPASPRSPVGAGAAAAFAPAAEPEEPPAAEEPPPPPAAIAPEPEEEEEPAEPQQLGLELGQPPGWQLPAIELLNTPQPSTKRQHDNNARAQLIVDTLASFGVDASVVEVNEGPTITQFGVEPGWEVRYRDLQLKDENGKTQLRADGRPRTERVETGRTRVRVNKITALQNDLALALAAPSLRIEAPVPGRAIVGIEVPNDTASVVSLRAVMESKEFHDLAVKSRLAMALGKGVSGVPVVADLAKMPHLLIAGATGSGKSVCMNAIICGIMMNATPDQVRFVMIDPKRVELSTFAGIPHMAFSEVIVDVDKVVGTLQAVVGEMEARYKKFAAIGVRNLEAYNRHPRVLKKLPYWVVIIDELADLMMAAPFEVEKLICRLAQLARATGIHLIVATQRPSVDVVTGLIKANFPTRIAFAVTSMTDSRTILDMGGAEKLLGRGDMLFMPTDASKPIRIQGVYVSDAEVERLAEFWKDERFRELAPETADDLLEQALIAQNGDGDIEVEEDDPIVERAKQLAMQHSRISPSLLQRRLKVGYVKASRLIELLEEDGIVGPRLEGESREVLVSTADNDGP